MTHASRNRAGCASVLSLLLVFTMAGAARAQLHEGCFVSALNRTAVVQADGTWVLPNVPSNQGRVRVRATCIDDGVATSGQSSFFTLVVDDTLEVPDIDFSEPADIPESLELTAPATPLTTAGATVQLTATATLPSDSTADVTGSTAGTTYRSSNPAVATVSAEGLVTAVASGAVVVSATNEGALAILEISVVTSGDSDGDGIPDNWEVAHGLDPNNPADALDDPDHDGLTNLEEYQLGTDPHNPDTDGDGLSDGDEVHIYHTNPLLYDTDGDGIGDGLEVQTGSNPLDPNSFNLTLALASIQVAPASFRIISNTALGGGSRQLVVSGRLIDGHTLDVTSRRYGTSYASSDLLIANFGPEDGRIYAGNDGAATITVSVGGHIATAAVTVQTFSPQAISFLPIPGFANSVVVVNRYAYIAAGATGLQVADVSDLSHPFIAGSVATSGNANDVWLAGSLAFVADGNHGLAVIDVSSPANPHVLSYAATPGVATDLAVSGHFVYVADEIGLRVFDVSDPAAPKYAGGVNMPGGRASGVDVSGNLAVVADSEGGVVVVDVSTPSAPRITGRTPTRPDGTSGAADLVVRDRLAYVADGAYYQLGGLRVVDFSDPTAPVVVGSSNDAFGLTSVAVEKGVALASDYYFANAVPIFQLNAGAPAFTGIVDFSVPPVQRGANGSGLDVHDGVVFMVGAATAGLGYQDNGSSGDGGLFIGQYALYLDDAGVPPTVSLTSPAQGGSLPERSLVLLTADAKDDVQVDLVDFLANGQRIATIFRPPYQVKYMVPVGATSLSVTAVAHDSGGNATTSDPVTLTVTPNPAPVARLLAPAASQNAVIGSQFVLAASASSQRGVTRVDFVINGTVAASVATAPYQATYRVPSGPSQLAVSVVAYDDFGASAPDGVTLAVVPDQPPVAVFLAPRDGDRVVEGSAVQVLGGIGDDLGIVRATLFADGGIGISLTAPPWTWSTPAPARGQSKMLRLQALDTSGQFTQTSITITGAADPLTSIHGTVLDPNGQPVADAQVVEDGSGVGATTGADGQFLISGVPTVSGSLSVTASASLNGAAYQVQSPVFTPVPGGQAELGQLVLAPYATTVVGVVLDSANRPVSGVKVVIVASGPLYFRGTTGADGSFRIPGVPQGGDITILASEIQGLFTLQSASHAFVNATITNLDPLVLTPTEAPTTFQGTVVDTANQPVAGALVKVYDDEILVTTTSLADGSFMIVGIPSGRGANFNFTARATVGGDSYYGSTVTNAIENGVTDAGAIVIDVVPASGAQSTTVQGTLATLSGQPVDIAKLIVMTEMDAYPGTAGGGQYAIAGIPSDEGSILVAATAVFDGQYLTVSTSNAYDPKAGDTTFIDALSFDDTYNIREKVAKRPRKLGLHTGLLPFGATSEAVCRDVSSLRKLGRDGGKLASGQGGFPGVETGFASAGPQRYVFQISPSTRWKLPPRMSSIAESL